MHIFSVPSLGEDDDSDVQIVGWFVDVGGRIEAFEPLVELETRKVTLVVPSPVSGVVVDLSGTPGETVEVGAPLATIDEDGSGRG